MKKCVIFGIAAICAFCLVSAGMIYAAGTSKQGAPAQTRAEKKIDINSASPEELMTLPGIGRDIAEDIIEARPYKTIQQLRLKKIVPAATYDTIKDMIVAKQKTGRSGPK